jgi:hypothetical protein
MLINQLFEDYDKKHKCKTPGAIYSTKIKDDLVSITVKLPKGVEVDLPDNEMVDLESDLHYAIEQVLAQFFD